MYKPLIQASPICVAMLDSLLWPILHLGVSYLAFRCPAEFFDSKSWLYKTRTWENDGTFYRKSLKISRWKQKLPDGAALFPGAFRKRLLKSRDHEYLKQFLMETYRGEWSHWLTLALTPIFFLWNPILPDAILVFYALATNLPCIFVQRYNRVVLQRILS